MSSVDPHNILNTLTENEVAMTAEIDRLKRVRQLFAKNRYDGKYRDKFEEVYEDILEAKDEIERTFEDGFQFSDLEEVLAVVTPTLKAIYDEFYGTLKDEKEAHAFLKDLVLFVYYEIEENINTWGWLKGIFRLVLRLWVAGKIAKYLKIAFDYVDGEVTVLKDKVETRVQKFTGALGF